LRVPLPESLLTAAIALGFAAVGEVLTRRRIRSLADANEAMLAGMGVCAALLFPLTLLFRRHALEAEAVLVGAGLLVAAAGRIFRRREALAKTVRPPVDPIARLILAGVAFMAVGFAAINFRYTYLWDGFLIWATKAQLLSHAGALTKEWYPGDVYDLRHLVYPNLVPLFEALVGLLRGGFDFDKFKPIFFVFYVSLLTGTYSAVRARLSARFAGTATLLVGLLPWLFTGAAAGGYADMPQAAVVAGVVSAAMRRRETLPWLIGALTTVKSEGTIHLGLACGAVLLAWLLTPGGGFLRRAAAAWKGVVIVAAFFALRIALVRWVPLPYDIYGGEMSEAAARIPLVTRLCLAELLDPRQWGLFWPAFLLAAAALIRHGSPDDRALIAAVVAGLGVLMVPFLVTSWPVPLQITQAYSRLAAQLAPAAAVALVLGYRAARDRIDRDRLDEVRVLR
jgi:hypothetical protein